MDARKSNSVEATPLIDSLVWDRPSPVYLGTSEIVMKLREYGSL